MLEDGFSGSPSHQVHQLCIRSMHLQTVSTSGELGGGKNQKGPLKAVVFHFTLVLLYLFISYSMNWVGTTEKNILWTPCQNCGDFNHWMTNFTNDSPLLMFKEDLPLFHSMYWNIDYLLCYHVKIINTDSILLIRSSLKVAIHLQFSRQFSSRRGMLILKPDEKLNVCSQILSVLEWQCWTVSFRLEVCN